MAILNKKDKNDSQTEIRTGSFINHASAFSRAHLIIVVLIFALVGGVIIWRSFAASSFGSNLPTAPAYPTSLPETTVTNITQLQAAVAAGNTRVKVSGRINIPVDWRWTKPNVWVYGDPGGGAALIGGSIKINTSDVWVSNLEIYGGTYDGIKLGDGAAASRIVIADNWIHDVGDQGVLIATNGAQDVWIMRNKIEKVGLTQNAGVQADGHGVYTGGYGGVTKRIYILANEIHPKAFGIQAYPEPDYVVISGNSIIGGDTRGGVVWYNGATNVQAVGNLIVDAPSAAFEVDSGGSAPSTGNRADENVCLRCQLWTPGLSIPPGSGNISTTSQTTADAFRVRSDQWGWLPPFLKDGSARSVANVGSSFTGSATPPSSACTYTINPGANVAAEFDKLTAGQTLCLNAGTYGSPTTAYILNNNSGTASAPLTITTTPGQTRATIEGQLTVGTNSTSGLRNNITVSHLSFKLDKIVSGRVNAQYGCTNNLVAGVVLTGNNIIFEYNDVSEASVDPSLRDTAIGVNYTGVRTSNVVIRNNKIHDYGACDHFDHGIYFDYVDNGQIYNNWIWNGGCAYGLGGDTTKGCGAGIQLWSDPIGTNIYGNVIDGAGLGFYISKNHNNVHNNVISNSRGAFYANGGAQPATAYDGYLGDSTNMFTNNVYFNSGEMCSNCTATASGNITSDPMFVDAVNHDYRLRSGSPVANYGLWDGIDPYFGGKGGITNASIPTGLKAVAGNGQVSLTWNANPSTDSIDTYQVYWTTDSTWSGSPQQNLSVGGTTYIVSGLTNGTNYYFRVSAHNAIGYGDWSSTVSSTPTAPFSSVPGDLNNDGHVTITDMSVLLSKYGTADTTADINKDGSVNITDLSILLSHYGA